MRLNSISVRRLGAVLALLLCGPSLFAQEEKPVFEEWAVLFMEGKQCGFGSTVTTQHDTPNGLQYRTVMVQKMAVKRLDNTILITETSKITEDSEGGVLSFEESTSSFGTSIESTGTREGDDLVVSSHGQTRRYHIPRLSALGPEKIREMSNAVPLKAGQPFVFNTFESDYPQAVSVETGKIEGQEMRDVRGTQRNLWKLTSRVSILPDMVSTLWVDDQSKNVEAVTTLPGLGELHAYVTNRAECMKEPEGVEIFAPSLIRPQHPIPHPADLERAVYRLTLTDPGKKIILWDQDNQHVIASGPGTCDLEVTALHFTPADATWQLPHQDAPELHRYLQSSTYLESNTPEIEALAKEAVGDEKNPVIAAQKIEKFVRDYITKKDLTVGFATAAETAKSREGDCTEHAVLCAALGRAVGLPTRCVLGLGYIPPGVDEPTISDQIDNTTGIFGGHMWAEAWIGQDKWVPMDAAMGSYDVSHIAITKTALEEINPLIDLETPVAQLMQNLKIDVLKTTLKSKEPVATPAPKPPVSSPIIKPTTKAPEAPKPGPAPVTPEPAPAPVPAKPAVD